MSLGAGIWDVSLEEGEERTEKQPLQNEEEEHPKRVQVASGWEICNAPPARHPTAFVLLLCSSNVLPASLSVVSFLTRRGRREEDGAEGLPLVVEGSGSLRSAKGSKERRRRWPRDRNTSCSVPSPRAVPSPQAALSLGDITPTGVAPLGNTDVEEETEVVLFFVLFLFPSTFVSSVSKCSF
jgi:hypothetical protein